jgi:hypothetical protein
MEDKVMVAERMQEIRAIAEFCKAKLDLRNATLPDEYGYQSLPLCIIDAVFSIGVRYTGTRNTVSKFCRHCGLNETSQVRPPNIATQLSIADFIAIYDRYGVTGMAEKIYQNRQRTSSDNGILKAEAVLEFARTLRRFEVNYFQDMGKVFENPDFEVAIKKIRGQGSGLSLRYFYMLAGSDDYVKPDRMLARFIESAIHRSLTIEESHDVIVGASKLLAEEYPHLTPRALDHLIWKYQRRQLAIRAYAAPHRCN